MGWWNKINCTTEKFSIQEVSSKIIDNEIEYKHRTATAKTEFRKILGTLSHLESDIHKIKPNTFQLLKYLNKDIQESANINPGPGKETFSNYYKELWTNTSLQENYLNTENVDHEIIMEELKKKH